MRHERIVLAHGGGGTLSRELLEEVILAGLSNPVLRELGDSAVVETGGGRLAFTTDSFVVKPLFFRGGDIGRLAVCGTVNDLAAAGAEPLWLSLGLVIEEGFAVGDLRRIIKSVGDSAAEAGVSVVCGDTKVVGRGEADGIFINTAGVGRVREGVSLSAAGARAGDSVICSGNIGEHGIAVMSEREGISFETPVVSDVAPLNGLAAAVLSGCRDVHVMRDPTRGGAAAVLNEIAAASGVTIAIRERELPVEPAVAAACDMLGIDVLTAANEGKLIVICGGEAEEEALRALRGHARGRNSAVIGTVREHGGIDVVMETEVGGERVVEMPYGEDLPRIC